MSQTPDERQRIATWEDLEFRQRKLDEREAAITVREQVVSATPGKKDVAHEAELAQQATVLSVREQTLLSKDQNLLVKLKDLDAKSRQVIARERAIEERERRLSVQEDAVRLAQDALRERETALHEATRTATSSAERLEASLSTQRKALEAQASTLRSREQAVSEAEALQQAQHREWDRALATQQADVAARSNQLVHRETRIKAREQAVDQHTHALQLRDAAVVAQEHAYRATLQRTQELQAAQIAEADRLKSLARALDVREMHLEKRERLVKQLVEQHKLKDELAAA